MLPGLSDGLSRKTQGHEAEGHFLGGQCQQILLAQHRAIHGGPCRWVDLTLTPEISDFRHASYYAFD